MPTIEAALVETAAGWRLTLTVDPGAEQRLRRAGLHEQLGGRIRLRVSPNLLPGEAFVIDTVTLAADGDTPAATRPTDERTHP